ncbi:hypothetical protein J6590_005951 [Homalodisca vitripennis]|nr:hypothetical protein J6590_005951 [Homalodisca vitripennis]
MLAVCKVNVTDMNMCSSGESRIIDGYTSPRPRRTQLLERAVRAVDATRWPRTVSFGRPLIRRHLRRFKLKYVIMNWSGLAIIYQRCDMTASRPEVGSSATRGARCVNQLIPAIEARECPREECNVVTAIGNWRARDMSPG